MALTLISHGAGSVNSGAMSPSVSLPITCSAGDVIYVFASTSSISLTGETFSAVTSGFNLYRCVASTSHSGNVVVTGAMFTPLSALMQAWTGVDNTLNTFGSIGASGGSTTASASVTTAAANSLVALFMFSPNSLTFSAGSGYTISDTTTAGVWTYGAEYANSVTPTSGTVVTPTATLSSSATWNALAISLAPSPGGGGSPARRRSHAFVI